MSLKDISWQVTEPEYRQDSAFSYSLLATYEREGFNKLSTLGEKIETPSLTFGSAVDAIITGGEEEFNNNFIVLDFPSISDTLERIAKILFETYGSTYRNIADIGDTILAQVGEQNDFYTNSKYANYRVKLIKENCQGYYSALYVAGKRQIINSELKTQVDATVRALKENEGTKFYFAENNPFDGIERYYQLKFKTRFNDIDYRCMADELIVDTVNKTITPVDLKTTGHPEWDFYTSFITWNYSIQARLYYRIIRDCMDKSDEFKDYTLENYRFIVANKNTLTPLVWEFRDTKSIGSLYYGKRADIECRDPFAIAKELKDYMDRHPAVPNGISMTHPNDIVQWLNSK